MASEASGTVSNNLAANLLTFTDTGTYGTVSSRILLIKDRNGIVLATINMGTNLTAPYYITADAEFDFFLTVVDNTGTFTTHVYYPAIGFYTIAYLNRFNNNNCGCDPRGLYVDEAEANITAALRFNIAGDLVNANTCILRANILINTY